MICTPESHETVRAQVAARLRRDSAPLDERASAMWRTLRPWPDAGLLVGECACHSTLAIETERELAEVG